jgi:general secretion pathway protein G
METDPILSCPSDAGISRRPVPGGLRGTDGFSLIEVVLVILIMGILASVAAQKYSGAIEQSRFDATREEMERIARAVVGNPDLTSGGVRSDFGYVGDVGALPPNLDALVTNPGAYATWRGPYLQSDFQQNPDDYKQDAWGAPYDYTGVALSSTGSGSTVTRQIAPSANSLLANSVMGSVTDGLNNAPGDSSGGVTVALVFPDGAGGMTTAITHPAAGGSFVFSGRVPVGNHLLRVVYHADTVLKYVSVLPASDAVANVRLPRDLWTPAQGTGARLTIGYQSSRRQVPNDLGSETPSGESAAMLSTGDSSADDEVR